MSKCVSVAVDVRDRRWTRALPKAAPMCRTVARAALRAASPHLARRPLEIGVVLASDAFVRALNRDYRGRNWPTNVLAFAALERPAPDAGAQPVLLGDVVVAFETAAKEARLEGKDLADHLSHLVVHGTLHLVGRDHETDRAAAAMERLEVAVLAGLGVPNPYAIGRVPVRRSAGHG
jgi:probable rRNA maturation factor